MVAMGSTVPTGNGWIPCRTGQEVHVVAVGGSITTGMGAARRKDAYLSLVIAYGKLNP